MSAAETIVRMGELAVSRRPGDVLVSVGLGSCIGLALVDPARSVAGLAHVMLPSSDGRDGSRSPKFADVAVPTLVERLVALGTTPARLSAVLVGGASMFEFTSSALDIGTRNERATLDELRSAGIPVAATATSGTTGRTIRVHVENGLVLCKEAGGAETELLRAL